MNIILFVEVLSLTLKIVKIVNQKIKKKFNITVVNFNQWVKILTHH